MWSLKARAVSLPRLIGNDRARLLRDLRDAFSGAEFVLDQTGLAQTIGKAIALVDAPHLGTT